MKRDAEEQLARALDLEHATQASAAIEHDDLAVVGVGRGDGEGGDEEIAARADSDAFRIGGAGGQGGEGFDIAALPRHGYGRQSNKAERSRDAAERFHHDSPPPLLDASYTRSAASSIHGLYFSALRRHL